MADLLGTLYNFSPAGKEQWRYRIARSGEHRITSPILVGPGGDLWFDSWDSNLYVVSPAGQQRQRISVGNYQYAACGSDGASLVCVVRLNRSDLAVEAYDAGTFTKRWTGTVRIGSGSWPVMGGPAIDLARQHVYATALGSQTGLLACFDLAKGTRLWSKTISSGMYSTPAIAPDGSVVVGNLTVPFRAIVRQMERSNGDSRPGHMSSWAVPRLTLAERSLLERVTGTFTYLARTAGSCGGIRPARIYPLHRPSAVTEPYT